MMKYLYESARVDPLFSHRPFIKAGYFFHALGEPLERKFTSLLASSLKQLLTSFGDLAPHPLRIFNDLKTRKLGEFQTFIWDELL